MTYRYTVQSVERNNDILLLTLAPRSQHGHVVFEPGQYATIGFMRGYRPTPMRCFSIVSTPQNGVLQFAIRVRGNFTQAVAKLKQGDAVRVQGPFGDFTLNPQYDRRVVLFAGGIGVTPFLSIIRDATERQLKLPITLLYSNRSSSNIPFMKQLRSLERRNPYLKVDFLSSDTTGSITDQHVLRVSADGTSDTTYFICGPKGFTHKVQGMLSQQGIHESRILSESFSQSSAITTGSGLSLRAITYGLSALVMVLATGAIMFLDLHLNLPKLVSADAAAKTAESSSNATSSGSAFSGVGSSNTDTNDTGNNNSVNSSGSDDNPSSQTTSPTTSQTNNSSGYTTYQPPVSSVS